jgi:TPR repeat protein
MSSPDALDAAAPAAAKAMDWYHKAADQGFGSAFAGIGQLYHLGNGVPQDFTEARRWFQLAADKGAAFGFVGLASLYLNGQGVPRAISARARTAAVRPPDISSASCMSTARGCRSISRPHTPG